jgi:peptide/nickel transport system permease protein
MRYALRRILWIVPTLAVVSLLAFWFLTRSLGPPRPPAELGGKFDALSRLAALPRFVNPDPRNLRDLALAAAHEVSRGQAGAVGARLELERLGGAALPHVIPSFDSLPPEGRARVALALAPVGRRMGVGTSGELDSAEAAVVFWTRYWQDRAVDFRPAVVRRLVRRTAEHTSSLRSEDIVEFDTFALPELMDALVSPRSPDEVERARRLTGFLGHVTGLPWSVAPGASPGQAREIVERWRSWWALTRVDYVTLDGPSRVAAMLTETQYGKWAAEAARSHLGQSSSGRPVLDLLRERGPVTLWLASSGIAGGYLTGICLGLAGAGLARNPWREPSQSARRRALLFDALLALLSVTVVALGAVLVGQMLAPSVPSPGSLFRAQLVMVLVSAALVSRHQRASTSSALEQEYTRTAFAFGASPLRSAWRVLRASGTPVVSLAGAELHAVFTSAFVVEVVFDLPGLAAPTVEAIQSKDVSWLMALAVGSTLAVALLQVLSDLVLLELHPRVAQALAAKRSGVE